MSGNNEEECYPRVDIVTEESMPPNRYIYSGRGILQPLTLLGIATEFTASAL